jgi:hypothetical protein
MSHCRPADRVTVIGKDGSRRPWTPPAPEPVESLAELRAKAWNDALQPKRKRWRIR